jgi:lipopolysaccharide cholinephosphotransferase
MNSIDINELKRIELNILKDVANFCDKHGLRYYLCGGTLIGTIRHKGFIPWDDDIDIIMPRPDYMKFMELYNQESNFYRVHSLATDPKWYSTFAEVEDTRTVKIYKNFNQKKYIGVNIDIFPTDGSPNDEEKRKRFWLINNILTRVATLAQLNFSVSNHFIDQDKKFSKIRTWLRTLLKFITIPIARCICSIVNLNKLVTRRAMAYDVDQSDYIGVSTFPHYGYKECVKGSSFLKIKERPFEGILFNTPDDYDEYLSNLYGDYMKIPPKEKQVSHHDFIAHWRDYNEKND